MKIFDKEDLITWSNKEKAIVGNQYYFADTIPCLKQIINVREKHTLYKIDEDDASQTFETEFEMDKEIQRYSYAIILPVDAIKDCEDTYRPCRNIREFYRVVMNDLPPLNLVTDGDITYELIDRTIHFRSKNTGTEYCSVIRSISRDTNKCIRILMASKSYLSFDQIFENYEIETEGKWQPFGVLED